MNFSHIISWMLINYYLRDCLNRGFFLSESDPDTDLIRGYWIQILIALHPRSRKRCAQLLGHKKRGHMSSSPMAVPPRFPHHINIILIIPYLCAHTNQLHQAYIHDQHACDYVMNTITCMHNGVKSKLKVKMRIPFSRINIINKMG